MHSKTLFFVALAGCGSSVLGVNKHGADTAAVSTSDADGDVDADADGEPETDPEITFAQAMCEAGGWFFNAAADDPQGIETIESGGLVRVFDGETKTAELGIQCDASSGFCEAEYNSDTVGATCVQAADREFRFIVFDEDGNRSAPYSVNGSAS